MIIWKVAIDNEFSSYDEFKQRKVVAQGWPDQTGDLSDYVSESRAIIQNALIEMGNEKKVSEKISRIFHNMITEIGPGDVVIAYKGKQVVGICEICDCFMYFFDRYGNNSGISPKAFDKNEFHFANCLYPVEWVDWKHVSSDYDPPPGAQGIEGIQKLGEDKFDAVLSKWKSYKDSTGFNPCPADIYNLCREKRVKMICKKDLRTVKSLFYGVCNQVILSGPPGTSKTRCALNYVEATLGKVGQHRETNSSGVDLLNSTRFPKTGHSGSWSIVQFHPSYNYEDFVRGIQMEPAGEVVKPVVRNRLLGDMVTKAKESLDRVMKERGVATLDDLEPVKKEELIDEAGRFILIIDEINRANVPAVLGELIYAMEYRDQPVATPYALRQDVEWTGIAPSDDESDPKEEKEGEDNTLTIPSNFYIIGTMNTADRSVGRLDYAIRRRFAFIECLPDRRQLATFPYVDDSVRVKAEELFDQVAKIFDDSLSPEFRKKDVQVGHTYFMAKTMEELGMKITYQVVPILEEYVSDGVLTRQTEEEIGKLRQTGKKLMEEEQSQTGSVDQHAEGQIDGENADSNESGDRGDDDGVAS